MTERRIVAEFVETSKPVDLSVIAFVIAEKIKSEGMTNNDRRTAVHRTSESDQRIAFR